MNNINHTTCQILVDVPSFFSFAARVCVSNIKNYNLFLVKKYTQHGGSIPPKANDS